MSINELNLSLRRLDVRQGPNQHCWINLGTVDGISGGPQPLLNIGLVIAKALHYEVYVCFLPCFIRVELVHVPGQIGCEMDQHVTRAAFRRRVSRDEPRCPWSWYRSNLVGQS